MKYPSYTAPFVLPKRDRDRLEELLNSGDYPEWFAMRFRIVLMSADGIPAKDIAGKFGVQLSTVYRWRKEYLRHGIREGLLVPQHLNPKAIPEQRKIPPHGRYTAPFVLSDLDRERIEMLVRQDGCSKWLLTRFQIILLSGDGLTQPAIAIKLATDIKSVYRWRATYMREGLTALLMPKRLKSEETHFSSGSAEATRRGRSKGAKVKAKNDSR